MQVREKKMQTCNKKNKVKVKKEKEKNKLKSESDHRSSYTLDQCLIIVYNFS